MILGRSYVKRGNTRWYGENILVYVLNIHLKIIIIFAEQVKNMARGRCRVV